MTIQLMVQDEIVVVFNYGEWFEVILSLNSPKRFVTMVTCQLIDETLYLTLNNLSVEQAAAVVAFLSQPVVREHPLSGSILPLSLPHHTEPASPELTQAIEDAW